MAQTDRKLVYLLTDGEYSDYSVIGVYSTKELAEKAKTLYNSDNDIEEIELDDIPEHPPGLLPYRVNMDRNGNVLSSGRCSASVSREDEAVAYQSYASHPEGYCLFSWAKSPEHAIKIANEKRLQMIASGEWLSYEEFWERRIYGGKKL